MPNTIVAIRYGERPDEAADRPSVVRLQYPTWTLAGEPRLRMPHRMLVIPAVEGNYIAPLTNGPIVMDLDMALRQRRGVNRANVRQSGCCHQLAQRDPSGPAFDVAVGRGTGLGRSVVLGGN